MPANNQSSNPLAVPDAQQSVSVIPTAKKASAPEPQDAPSDAQLTATVHYFPLGDAYRCYACEDPKAKVHTIRITRTIAGATLVTPMCENCAGEEVDGVLERGDLILSDDGTHLVSPMALELAQKLAEQKENNESSAHEDADSAPVPQ